jgi:hypothetical protein
LALAWGKTPQRHHRIFKVQPGDKVREKERKRRESGHSISSLFVSAHSRARREIEGINRALILEVLTLQHPKLKSGEMGAPGMRRISAEFARNKQGSCNKILWRSLADRCGW